LRCNGQESAAFDGLAAGNLPSNAMPAPDDYWRPPATTPGNLASPMQRFSGCWHYGRIFAVLSRDVHVRLNTNFTSKS
jgi:hypothetical protein